MSDNNKKIFDLLTKLDTNVSEMKADLGTLKSDVSTLKSDVSTLTKNVDKLKDDVDTLKKDVKTQKMLQGKLYEEAMRSKVEKEFGVRFAQSFSVTGLVGLARLVTVKTRGEDDVSAQIQSECRLLMELRSSIDEYTVALKSLAAKSKPDAKDSFRVELEGFADDIKVVVLTQNMEEFSTFCRKYSGLTLALFCSRYIKSRPLKEMQFDCRGDVVRENDKFAIIRQLEFKRGDAEGGVSQVFEHIAAEMAAMNIIYTPKMEIRGRAMVCVLNGEKVSRPSFKISDFDDKIELINSPLT